MTRSESRSSPVLATMFRHVFNPVVAMLLLSPASGLLAANLLLVRYRGRRTGRELELPVGYVRDGARFLVIVGAAEHKTWRRNFSTPQPVELVLRRDHVSATARLLSVGSQEAVEAAAAIRGVRPRARTIDGQQILEIRPTSAETENRDRRRPTRIRTTEASP